MDFSTIVGFIAGAALLGFGLEERGVLATFLNAHGIVIVVGGTIAAMLVNTPMSMLKQALAAMMDAVLPASLPDSRDLVAELVRLSEGMHRDGISSLRSHSSVKGDGFLTFAVRAAQENQDSARIRQVLEDSIRQKEAAMNRLAGLFQTMAVLAPMFGLLGTIIGIVGVLKDITNPQSIGPSMAIAMTTAFYGILFSALFCTPLAGKIRNRAQQERRMREMIMVGTLDILAGAVPVEVEHHLEAFVQK